MDHLHSHFMTTKLKNYYVREIGLDWEYEFGQRHAARYFFYFDKGLMQSLENNVNVRT